MVWRLYAVKDTRKRTLYCSNANVTLLFYSVHVLAIRQTPLCCVRLEMQGSQNYEI